MLDLIKNNKKIAILLVAFLILFPYGIYGLKMSTPQTQEKTKPTKAPNNLSISPTQAATTLSEKDPQKRLLEYMQNRQPLSASDQKVKETLLTYLGHLSSGIIFEDEQIMIEYTSSVDLFQVEIRTTNTLQAKQAAIAWFKSKGLSDEGVCRLPVSFYLNFEIKEQLGEGADSFNPLPENC